MCSVPRKKYTNVNLPAVAVISLENSVEWACALPMLCIVGFLKLFRKLAFPNTIFNHLDRR